MIQRIQSIYLLLGALTLLALLLFDDIWQGAAAVQAWFSPVLLVLIFLTVAIAIGAIFMYKDRKRQRSAVVVAQFLALVLLAVFYLGLYLVGALGVTVAGVVDTARVVALLLPVVAYIFFYLARKGIERDIALVRSMDRLR